MILFKALDKRGYLMIIRDTFLLILHNIKHIALDKREYLVIIRDMFC